MATLVRADIAAAMSLILQDRMVDQFRRDQVILHLLEVKNNGKNSLLTWNAKFPGRTAGGAYAEGADMADGDYDSHTRAQAALAWAEYRSGAKVSGLAMSVTGDGYVSDAQAMGGDLFDEELVDAVDEVAMLLATDVYAGDPTASPMELAGFAAAVDDAAGTFAGLASSTYSDWLGNEDTLATASLSFENLRAKLIRPVRDATGRDPDFITCSGALFDLVKGLFDEQADIIKEVRRFDGQMVDIKAMAGARALDLDGVPVIEDRHATANTFCAWSARDVEIVQLPAKTPGRSPERIAAAIKMLTGLDVKVEDVVARMKRSGVLTPTIEFLAQSGDAYKAMVKVYAQIKWKRRNAHAKLTLT